MRRFAVFAGLLLLSLAQGATFASDLAREKKWADELLPNVVVGDPVYLAQADGHRFLGLYSVAPEAKLAVVVAHGIGVHPDHGIIGTLRSRLVDFGFTTLSIQMPILAADAEPAEYRPLFPAAAERLRLAVAFLKGKGYARVALVSHSLGTRMAQLFMAGGPSGVEAWAALGFSNGDLGYEGAGARVLDLYGSRDLPAVLKGAERRKASLAGIAGSRQVVVDGADHFFADREEAMLALVRDFLNETPKRN